MDRMPVEEMYEWFLETFTNFGTFLLELDDEEVGWRVFEEFDTDAITVLYIDNLKYLLDNKKIDEKILDACLELREKYMLYENINSGISSVHDIKTNPKWRELLELADRIKAMIDIFENKSKL